MVSPSNDPGSSFDTAHDLADITSQPVRIQSAIDPKLYTLELPGSDEDPGHRQLPGERHILGDGDQTSGVETRMYNFQDLYGLDPDSGLPLSNLINEQQKDAVRQILELYDEYLGVQFIETANQGLTIAVGNMGAVNPLVSNGPGEPRAISGFQITVFDAAEAFNDEIGGDFFQLAMRHMGHQLGLGFTRDLPPFNIMGQDDSLAFGQDVEGRVSRQRRPGTRSLRPPTGGL